MPIRAYNVVVTTPVWKVNGVNTFSANLVRGLLEKGVEAHLLVTHPPPFTRDSLPWPEDLPVRALPAPRCLTWPCRWRALAAYLQAHAPCIYLPNNDYRHSCALPGLHEDVASVGILHSDSDEHYGDLDRMGPYWDAAVAVSAAIEQEASLRQPGLRDRLHKVPCGIVIPPEFPSRTVRPQSPLRIVYAGRLDQHQKRVLDLPRIAEELGRRNVPYVLSVYGDGEDGARLRTQSQRAIDAGRMVFHGAVTNAALLRAYREHDVFLLPSAFEGLPITLLEAMAAGCVPVVSAIRSGIPEVLRDGENGLTAPVGDVAAFATALAALHADVERRQRMAQAAYDTVCARYSISAMTSGYLDVFNEAWETRPGLSYRRAHPEIVPPPFLKPLWRCRMPAAFKLGKR
jgi:glycosyltransferase involved in cell wall biosynthesis